jgi:GT2 family glycosyltransferase
VKSIALTAPADLAYEIVIVDNASSDGARQYLPAECPQAVVEFSEENLGYGRANNLAFDISKGRYVFVLNPDTELVDDSWVRLVETLDTEAETGIAGPKIILGDGTVQSSCARKEDRMKHCVLFEIIGLNRIGLVKRANLPMRSSYYPTDEDRYVEAVSGAAMLVRREVYAEIGGFDPVFLHGGEDVFFCNRCRELGHRVKFVSSARLSHYHNKSGTKASVRTFVRSLDSRYTLYRKTEGQMSALVFRSAVLVFYCLRLFAVAASAALAGKSDRKDRWLMWRAVFKWCLSGHPI